LQPRRSRSSFFGLARRAGWRSSWPIARRILCFARPLRRGRADRIGSVVAHFADCTRGRCNGVLPSLLSPQSPALIFPNDSACRCGWIRLRHRMTAASVSRPQPNRETACESLNENRIDRGHGLHEACHLP